MKKIILIVFVFICFFQFSIVSFAEDTQLSDSFSIIGADKLEDIIDENAKDFLSKNEIDISDYSWVNKLTPQNVFSGLIDVLKNGLKKPLKTGAGIFSIIFLTAGFTSLDLKSGTMKSLSIATTLSVSLVLINNIFICISSSVSLLKYISGFMLSFIPIFIVAVSMSGAAVSASVSGGLILVSARAVSYFASNYVMPIMGGYLSLNLVSSISPFSAISQLGEMVKKAIVWTLSFVFTLFVGIISIQSSINGSADTLALKTTKFIIGTCIPIAGGPLSESANTIYSSMNLIKSSIGVYGVVIIAVAVIPFIVEILLWKGVISVCQSISASFSQNTVVTLLSSVNYLLSVILAIILFSGGLFIISLGIVISATKL